MQHLVVFNSRALLCSNRRSWYKHCLHLLLNYLIPTGSRAFDSVTIDFFWHDNCVVSVEVLVQLNHVTSSFPVSQWWKIQPSYSFCILEMFLSIHKFNSMYFFKYNDMLFYMWNPNYLTISKLRSYKYSNIVKSFLKSGPSIY